MSNNEDFTLLQTKLNKPRVSDGLVARSRLIEHLDKGLNRNLTLISAPAGYGKTTLAAVWLQNIERPAAWLSLDENDNDLILFFSYLVAALRTLNPLTFREAELLLEATQQPPTDYLVSTFINAVDGLPDPFILVLDDYHTIKNTAIEDFVDRLITYIPSQMHMVICCRSDPRLPLALLRARRQLNEIRVSELCFTLDETQLLLEQTSGQQVERDVTRLLAERTEGWVTGLHLAALTMQTHRDQKALLDAFTGNANLILLDYLLEEVLSKQPQALQDFLLQTSILDRFCAPLCDAVLGNGEQEIGFGEMNIQGTRIPKLTSRDVLHELERSSFFITRLDDHKGWYRYHHLFRELTYQRLASGPGQAEQAHRRASAWFAANGYRDEALHHALAGNDMARAIGLIEQYRIPAMNQARWRALERWLKLLPVEVVQARPSLSIARIVVLNTTKVNWSSLSMLEHAELLLKSDDNITENERLWLQAEINALLSSLVLFSGQYEQALELTQQALKHLPPTHTYLRGIALAFQGLALQALGNTDTAVGIVASSISNTNTSTPIRVQAYIALCFIYLTAGDLSQLHQSARHMRSLGERVNYPLAMTWADYFLGVTHYEWNELDDATLSFEAVYRSRYLASSLAVHRAFIGILKTHWVCYWLEQANTTLDKLQAYTIESGSAGPPPDADILQSLILYRQGDTRIANRWTQTVFSAPRPTPLFFYEDNGLMQLTVQLIIQDERADWREVTDQLQRLLQEAKEKHGTLRTIQILAHLALAYCRQGPLDTAHTHLEQAITLAQPGDFIRTFVDLGPQMSNLLKQFVGKASLDLTDNLVQSKANVEYAIRILDVFPKIQSKPDSYSIVWQQAQTVMIDPLTRRESEVLVLLAQDLSYQEIANQLVVTINTIKKHASHSYQKLGVNNRGAAVEKARTLNILTNI